MTDAAEVEIPDETMAGISKTPESKLELPRSFSGEWVAAMRGLRNRRYRNPADPKVSHAQPPLHGNAGTKKRRQS